MLDKLALLVHARARVFAIAAAVGFVVAGALGAGVNQRLDPYDARDASTESAIAGAQLERAGYYGTDVVVLVRDAPESSRVAALSRAVGADPDVVRVTDFASTGSRDFVSRDGRSTFITAQLSTTSNKERLEAAERLVDRFANERGVVVGGPVVADLEVNEQTANDLKMAEIFAFPILFALAFLFFRSFVAALLPLMVGVLSIVATMFMLNAATYVTSISVFAMNLVTALGLALAIDYSLFIVSRYREEIARSGPGVEAMRKTLATAGRTVLFSSVTVAGATGSLMLFPQNFLSSMGVGGAFVALLSGLISLTVLPAVLVLLGRRVNALAPARLQRRRERESAVATDGFWYRLTRFVMRFPGRIALVTACVLIALGLPALGIAFNAADAQVLPTSAAARQVDDALRADFPPFRDTPATLVVSSGDAAAVAAAAARVDGVAEVRPPIALDGGLSAVEVISSAAPLTESSKDMVRDLRSISGVEVTGFTAGFLDLQSSLLEHLPLVMAVIAGITLIVLFLFTGSLVLPFTQLVMNLLGIAAVFGVLVLIFQDGRLEGLLGYTSSGAIEATQPLLLFALGFGLATDYGVFLLSRIKEARDQGAPDSEAVSIGLERTGRIVTAAALLFAVAVGAFVTSDIAFIKQIGLGIALVVLIDATIIRALLVPSLMQLLGKWNWWAPAPLTRVYERFGVSETAPPELAFAAAVPAEPPVVEPKVEALR
jgi:RND superfamily putative drug exporter